jgi:hypothetical protein
MKNYVVIRHKVKDYATWRAEFDSCHDKSCGKYGIIRTFISRNADDPTDLCVTIEVEDLAKAREVFSAAPTAECKESMKRAGVVGTPTVMYLEEIAGVGVPVGAGVSSSSSGSSSETEGYEDFEGD